MIKKSLFFIALTLAASKAETALWTAQGTVTTATGEFEGTPLEQAVQIRMTYNDEAVAETPHRNVLGSVDIEYRQEIDLNVEIIIGEQSWIGEVNTAPSALPRTLVTEEKGFGTAPEFIEVILDTSDAATITPSDSASDATELLLEFIGSQEFIAGGIKSTQLNAEEITSASGSITGTSSADQLTFTLDPTTVEIITLLPIPVTPPITVNTEANNFAISWPSSLEFSYRIEQTTTLEDDNWIPVITLNGTGDTLSRTFSLTTPPTYFRIVTDQPLE